MIKIRDGLMGKVGLELKFNTWVEGLPRRRQWHPTPVLLPGKSHGWRSLVGCSPWGRWGSDTTERLHLNFSLSCTGEGNGNPLQCSCLEHPRDGGAWWAAVYGVTQSQTRLKQQQQRDFPGVPAVGTPHFQCRGLRFDSLSWNQDPIYPSVKKENNTTKTWVEFDSVKRGGNSIPAWRNCMNKVQRWEQVCSCQWEGNWLEQSIPFSKVRV